MGKPSAPPAPDYAAAAKEQGAANKETAIANNAMNRVDQYSPDGSSTWTMRPGADPNNPQVGDYRQTTSLSPTNQALYDADKRISTGLYNTAESGLGRVNNVMGTPFDTSGMTPYSQAPQAYNGYGGGGGPSFGGPTAQAARGAVGQFSAPPSGMMDVGGGTREQMANLPLGPGPGPNGGGGGAAYDEAMFRRQLGGTGAAGDEAMFRQQLAGGQPQGQYPGFGQPGQVPQGFGMGSATTGSGSLGQAGNGQGTQYDPNTGQFLQWQQDAGGNWSQVGVDGSPMKQFSAGRSTGAAFGGETSNAGYAPTARYTSGLANPTIGGGAGGGGGYNPFPGQGPSGGQMMGAQSAGGSSYGGGGFGVQGVQGPVNDTSRSRVENSMLSRLDKQFGQDEAALTQQLMNSGIEKGTDAWNREMNRLTEQRDNQRMNAIMMGGEEESRQVGLNSGLQQQAFNQGMAGQGTQFNQGLAAAGFNNQTRGQQFQEGMTMRNIPLNEINALRTGSQVATPQFGSYYTNNAQAAPVFDAVAQQGQYDMAAAGQKQAGSNAALGAGAGVVAAGIMAF